MGNRSSRSSAKETVETYFFYCSLFFLITLTGCTTLQPVATQNASSNTEVMAANSTPDDLRTIIPKIQSPTVSLPKIETLSNPTERPVTELPFQPQCFQVTAASPERSGLTGSLVYNVLDGLSIYNFEAHLQRNIKGVIIAAGVSPDGKWLAYKNKSLIIIESASGDKQAEIPIEPGWFVDISIKWLDNQRIWFSTSKTDLDQPYISPVVILNPFTGEKIIKQPVYPGIMSYQVGPRMSMGLHFGYSSLVFDPSLNLVIYPEFREGPNYFLTLWNSNLQKAITRIPSSGDYAHLPIWQPEKNLFLVVGYPDLVTHHEEWMTVTPEGRVTQISHFANLGKEYVIRNNASVSPDGKYLAFSLFIRPDNSNEIDAKFIIINLETKEVTDTCTPIKDGWYNPIWSMDSIYVAIAAPMTADGSNQLLLLDVRNRREFELFEGKKLYPIGWLLP